MDATGSTPPGGIDGTSVTLSTGHEITLPLTAATTATGVVLSADRESARELLPTGLGPIQVLPGRTAVTFLCVEYHRIGRDGAFEPYDEFGVLLPAVEGGPSLPYVSLARHRVGAYVWYLPVTNEPGKALGVDVWGYPKEVGEITHEDDGSARRTSVAVDGQEVIDVTIHRPRTIDWTIHARSYSTKADALLTERLEFHGDIGAWPYSEAVSYTLGDHRRARRLRELDLGERALARFAADGEFVIHAGQPVTTA